MAVSTTLLLLALGPRAARADADPGELLTQIQHPALDPGDARAVRDVELELGPARLTLEQGLLFPARLADGRAGEFVFVGQARFRLDPPDPVEAGQLELFTEERTLDAAVEEAVIVAAGAGPLAALLEGLPRGEAQAEPLARARGLHERWLEGPERRGTGIDSAMFKAMVGDSAFQEHFALWCRSSEAGEFLYRVDPEQAEPITLAAYHPPGLSGWDRRRLEHELRAQQRRGRSLGLRVEDLGRWDTWISTSLGPGGRNSPGQEGFEARHYEIDATIRRERMRLEGLARIELEAQASGRRVVHLDLARDLVVDRVADGGGRGLFFFRSGEELAVLLPEPSWVGERIALVVSYRGWALRWADGKNFDLVETRRWYPHAGAIDRATYDVKLRWPRRYQLLAGGRVVERGRSGGYLWERRRLDLPAIAFSFALGRFDVLEARLGTVDLTLGFSRGPNARTTPAARAEVLDALRRSLEYFEATFGPYPLGELTVVTVPRAYSQSYLGFVALARSITTFTGAAATSASWFRDTTIAHELAHQWWGNLVGWRSYRDQWLSEGLANYAALLYDGHVRGEGTNFLTMMSAGWRDSLTQTTDDGRTIESLGPVVLGVRLNSSRATDAYRPIVYRKGAVVLAMLARAVGQERLHEVLRELVGAAQRDELLTTEGFLARLERAAGLDLDGFARQYVYGTGIPQVYYSYDAAEDGGGGWHVEGEARLLARTRHRLAVVRNAAGELDLGRELAPEPQAGPTTLVVPFRVTLEGAGTGETARRAAEVGQFFLDGGHERFEIATGARPTDLELDPRGEILANFHSASLEPKRYLRYRAEDLAAAGDLVAAEARYREALALPADPPEDVRLRLSLVRLYLDQRRDAEARAELAAVERDLSGGSELLLRVERDVLRGRLEILEGDPAAARRRLKRTLRMGGDRPHGSWHKLLGQLRLATEREAIAEAYALLAIAAHQTARADELRWAAAEARKRGVDVSLLEERSTIMAR